MKKFTIHGEYDPNEKKPNKPKGKPGSGLDGLLREILGKRIPTVKHDDRDDEGRIWR